MLLKSKLCTIKTNISLTYSISRLTLPALRVNNVQSSKAFFMSLLSGICIKIVIFSFLNIKLYSHVEYAYLNFVHPSKEAEIFISIMCIVLNISVIYNGTACLRPFHALNSGTPFEVCAMFVASVFISYFMKHKVHIFE